MTDSTPFSPMKEYVIGEIHPEGSLDTLFRSYEEHGCLVERGVSIETGEEIGLVTFQQGFLFVYLTFNKKGRLVTRLEHDLHSFYSTQYVYDEDGRLLYIEGPYQAERAQPLQKDTSK